MKGFLRLAIAGIHIESSTFSPLRSRQSDFLATRGDEMFTRYPFLAKPEFAAVIPVPLVHFRALPGGSVDRGDYEAMKDEILARLDAAGPIDGFYFDVHGAMAVVGLADAEADLLATIRERFDQELPVTCSQDLHGNVSDELVAMVDFITTYRTAPHVDWMETRERAVRMLVDWWLDPRPVFRARVGISVLVSGEMSSTETQPGRRLYAPLEGESKRPGVMDASLWVGYAWADQARAGATAVVTGTELAAVKQTAEAIAQRYWDARNEFRFIAPAGSVDWCLDQALALNRRGVFLSDAGDNPTAGAAGDVTDTLAALLRRSEFSTEGGATAIFASIPDAAAIARCAVVAQGEEISLSLGGKLDPVHGVPLQVTGKLARFSDGDATGGGQAVIQCDGVSIIVTERRKPFHLRRDFTELGLDPLEETVTVVKIGYLEPELRVMASHHWLVLSPGAVAPKLTGIPYEHLTRPMFPHDVEFAWSPMTQLHRSF